MRFLIATLFAACVIQAQIESPRMGIARLGDGTVRPVEGVSGNAVLGPPLAHDAIQSASYGDITIVKFAESLRVLDRDARMLFEVEAPPGRAIIGFGPHGRQALVHFPAAGVTLRCDRDSCEAPAIAAPEGVGAVALDKRGAVVFAAGHELIRIRLTDGATVSRQIIEEPPSLVSPDGSTISLPEGTEADWMAEDRVSLKDSSAHSSALDLKTREATVLDAASGLALFLFDGSSEKPLAGFTDLGSWPGGGTKEFRFRIRNNGGGPEAVQNIAIAGQSFRLSTVPSLPYTVAPQNFVEFRVDFTPRDPGSYSAVLRVNTTEVLVRASATAAPTLSVEASGGSGSIVTSGSAIDFGRIVRGSSATRSFRLANGNATSVPVSTVNLDGIAFRMPAPPAAPLDLKSGASIQFEIVFEPKTSGAYTATLTLGALTFKLSGVAFDPPLPRPVVDTGGRSLPSARQQKLSVRFDTPAQSAANGTLKMEFRPSAPGATDDPAVRFLSGGSRTQSFRVLEGDTSASFGSEREILFQTGTTAGTLLFTAELGSYKEQVTVEVAPDKVGLSEVTAVRSTGIITVSLTGYDNSRTAGTLSFTFYDTAGKAITGAIPADAKPILSQFFAGSPAGGGTFLMRVAFPVSGDSSGIGSVDVKIANGAGAASMDRIPVR